MDDLSPSRLIPRLSASPPLAGVSYHERRLRRWMLGVLGGLALLAAGCWTLVFWPLP